MRDDDGAERNEGERSGASGPRRESDPFIRMLEPRRESFSIGLTPLPAGPDAASARSWAGLAHAGDLLRVDAARSAQLAVKARYLAAAPGLVFAAEPGWEAAAREAAHLIAAALEAAELPSEDPAFAALRAELRRRSQDAGSPLLSAAMATQEDLLLMARDGEDRPFRLVAGSLSFPSNWSLPEKLGKPMALIHEPVPGFGPGARNAEVIDRIFAALAPERPVERFGWSIAPNAALAQPPAPLGRRGFDGIAAAPEGAAALQTEIKTETETEMAPAPARVTQALIDAVEGGALRPAPHFRVERQTLSKLPESGAILFTVRIAALSFEAMAQRSDGARLAAALSAKLAALDAGQLAYKGLTSARPALCAALADISGGG
ncbi:MAG: heme-dependent oxidative N-demethylase subunit alpha family protein [Pseudomonadota bacterium]